MTNRDLAIILGTLVETRDHMKYPEATTPSDRIRLDLDLTEAIGLLRTELAITERDRAAIVRATARGERA